MRTFCKRYNNGSYGELIECEDYYTPVCGVDPKGIYDWHEVFTEQQLQQAHREGWEQAKEEAIIRCEAQERNRSEMSAVFYVAAMEYGEATNG